MRKKTLTSREAENIIDRKYPDARNTMSPKREMQMIADLFDLYERSGFRESYQSYDFSLKKCVVKKFRVLGRITFNGGKADAGFRKYLPMWRICYEDGTQEDVGPEGIAKACLERSYDKRHPTWKEEQRQRFLSKKLADLLAANPGIKVTPIVLNYKKSNAIFLLEAYCIKRVYPGKFFWPARDSGIVRKIRRSDNSDKAMRSRRSDLGIGLGYDLIEGKSDREIKKMYEELPWQKTIFVEIEAIVDEGFMEKIIQ